MDELQFRRTIYTDPNNESDDVKQACLDDEKKAQFVKEMQQFDEQILSALKVDVPENLSQRILLNQSLSQHRKQKTKTRIQLALAASIAFAVGIAVTNIQSSPAFENVGQHAIAHAQHEQHYFDNNSSARVSLASVNDIMSEYNAKFTGEIGELMSAGFCGFGGNRSLHLTYKGQKDIVNIFIVPEKESLKFVNQFSDQGLHGMASIVNQHHLIIVADKAESITPWQEKINNNMSWSI